MGRFLSFVLIWSPCTVLFYGLGLQIPEPLRYIVMHPQRSPSIYGDSEVTESFGRDLRSAIPLILRNNQVMFTLCGEGIHAFYAANLFCSLAALNYSSVLWIALTRAALRFLRKRNCVAILWREELNGDMFYFTIIKWFVARYVLRLGYEVFYCDTDAVFLGNPDRLFFEGVDIEFTAEIAMPVIEPQYPANVVNCGHVKMFPTNATVSFVDGFIEYAHARRYDFERIFQHDQTIMQSYLKMIGWTSEGKCFLFGNGVKLGFFDPMLSVTGSSINVMSIRSRMTTAAIERGITRPVLYHLAFWPPERKPSALDERNLWFVDFPNSLQCREPIPNGTKLFWDNQYNTISRFSRRFRSRSYMKALEDALRL
jgi:hypothetical protein